MGLKVWRDLMSQRADPHFSIIFGIVSTDGCQPLYCLYLELLFMAPTLVRLPTACKTRLLNWAGHNSEGGVRSTITGFLLKRMHNFSDWELHLFIFTSMFFHTGMGWMNMVLRWLFQIKSFLFLTLTCVSSMVSLILHIFESAKPADDSLIRKITTNESVP